MLSDYTALMTLSGPRCRPWSRLSTVVKWCDDNLRDLVMDLAKFRQNKDTPRVETNHNKEVEVVDSYKYVSSIFDSA